MATPSAPEAPETTFKWRRFVISGTLWGIVTAGDVVFHHNMGQGAFASLGVFVSVLFAVFAVFFVLEMLRAALPNNGQLLMVVVIFIGLLLVGAYDSHSASMVYKVLAYGGWFIAAFACALDHQVAISKREKAAAAARQPRS
jgi:hypothetical protein